ncbi:MAG: PTS N-acetylgalactosamine transporter subunit IIB [Deltaproteobacteria bacterium]|nr:MAG: PTS N-acetylgalactosamine transporter subunit IIB [Deltaproteobacteria bacterium]
MLNLLLTRVDNRLVHGQVLEGWVPRLGVKTIFVADNALYGDSFNKAILEAMGQGVIDIIVVTPSTLARAIGGADKAKIAILFRNIPSVVEAFTAGFDLRELNLGNIHPKPGATRLTDSVYVDENDLVGLKLLIEKGVRVEARSLPTEPGVLVTGALLEG